MFLADLVAARLPDEPEALGLFALLCYCEARRPAARDAAGDFVPVDRQDVARWDRALLARADGCLRRASRIGSAGPFQYEAAIQAAHCDRLSSGSIPWPEIVCLYGKLLRLAPTVGARIGHALALSRVGEDPAVGLAHLDAIDPATTRSHQPWWAARADLLALAGRRSAALEAYRRALDLTTDPALRRFLEAQAERLG